MKTGSKLILALACALAVPAAYAQSYPTRAVKLIVPFPPGGGTDYIARELALHMGKQKNWNVVVENRPGAGGSVGLGSAANAKPDGYTIVLGQTSNLAILPTLQPKIQYDPVSSFTPVALVAEAPLVFVGPREATYSNAQQFIEQVKAAPPNSMNFGIPGIGTVAHLTSVLFQQKSGIKIENIPYKGAADGIPSLIGNQIQAYMSSASTLTGAIEDKQIKPLGVTSLTRMKTLPDVPTLDESGFKGFNATTWFGILVPAATPDEIVQVLGQAIRTAMDDKKFQTQIENSGAMVVDGDQRAFAERIKTDTAMWADVIKTANITLK
ncbi:hypothetical protein TKWG_23085 [Advenella kashmirensis WT001]|uniref:LacI family transcriptional regulator n=1 Tax=Advenella kashmirensis (strain DSM 17095 / LMG 22695 / WT001) TaxID=1036672 RepID=I3UGT3_ADVKW|nr:tripartite tricarboxylate transporter substrate binding protein [Advenella kashmirensis]AFK64221.1 hypothetical protein TKWG_23085 [Advenella kashmirensis WT001]